MTTNINHIVKQISCFVYYIFFFHTRLYIIKHFLYFLHIICMKKTLLFQFLGSIMMLGYVLVFPNHKIEMALATIMGYLLEILWNQKRK